MVFPLITLYKLCPSSRRTSNTTDTLNLYQYHGRSHTCKPNTYYSDILATCMMNWPPVFHLQWPGHVPHVRQHLPTTIVWNSPMRELIGSVMVSSLLLPTFGTLSLPLYFRLPSTFLPSKGRSITTLGARWHDFFLLHFLDVFLLTLFRYFIKLFYYTSFPFFKGCRLEKGHIVPVLCSHS